MLALNRLSPFSVLVQSGSPGHGLVRTDLVFILQEPLAPLLILFGNALTDPKVSLVDATSVS